MDKIILHPFGELSVVKPNLAAALDIVATWGDNPSRAQIGRLCAAAMGICCPSVHLPGYSMIDCHPIAYGGRCLERLLNKGVAASDIYSFGAEIINFMAEQLPLEKEVQAAEDFTEGERVAV